MVVYFDNTLGIGITCKFFALFSFYLAKTQGDGRGGGRERGRGGTGSTGVMPDDPTPSAAAAGAPAWHLPC